MIKVTDLGDLSDTLTTTINVINVNDPPEIITSSLPDATEGVLYEVQLDVSDPDIGDSLSFSIKNGPEWLSIDETGLLSGTPANSDVGSDIVISVLVTDSESETDGLRKKITVYNVLEPPANFVLDDMPDDQGHSIKLTWNSSPDEASGNVMLYRIFRSRSDIITEAIPLTYIDNVDSLLVLEQNYTILIDSVYVGTTEYIDECVPLSGVQYNYWIQTVGTNGVSEKCAAGCVTAVESAPNDFSLAAPYPNPFNPTTTIQYAIPENSHVRLVIYDVLGRKVSVLKDIVESPGIHEAVWDGRNDRGELVGSGIYIYRLDAGSNKAHGKVMFLR